MTKSNTNTKQRIRKHWLVVEQAGSGTVIGQSIEVAQRHVQIVGQEWADYQRRNGNAVVGSVVKGGWTAKQGRTDDVAATLLVRPLTDDDNRDALLATCKPLSSDVANSNISETLPEGATCTDAVTFTQQAPMPSEPQAVGVEPDATVASNGDASNIFGSDIFDREATVNLGPVDQRKADAAVDGNNPWLLSEAIMPYSYRTLLFGKPGTGKSFAARKLADGLSLPLAAVSLTEQYPMAELRGHFVARGRDHVWMDGNLMRPFRYGGVGLIDEIDEGGADALAFLSALLNDPEVAVITLPTGETVTRHPDFYAVAAMNGMPEDLHPRLQSRFPVTIEIDRPNPKAFNALPQDIRKVARKLANSNDPSEEVDLRSWFAFADLRERTGHQMLAARAVFGARYGDIVAAIVASNDTSISGDVNESNASEGSFST